MNSPASFSSLPPELVANICSDPNLDKEGLIALRLTSKAQGIHASATKTFAKRYFTDVLLLWNKYSLETFVEISQHPIFGPSIHKIQLSCARYEEADFEDSIQELLDQGLSRCEFSKKVQQLAQRCDLDHEQFESGHVDALLDQAFCHLARSDTSFVLAVSADEEKSLGRSKVLGPEMGSKGWWANPSAALGYLLRAVDRKALKIHNIEVDVEVASVCELEDYDLNEWQDLESLRSLSELTINLWVPSTLNAYRDLGMVQHLLAMADHLKIVHIRGNIFLDTHMNLRLLARLISRLPLEELHPTSIEMKQNIMTAMLMGVGSSLRRLKLADCQINGSWKQIPLSIQQHMPQLDNLHIYQPWRAWMIDSEEYKGVDNVRKGVAKLLRAREDLARKKGLDSVVHN